MIMALNCGPWVVENDYRHRLRSMNKRKWNPLSTDIVFSIENDYRMIQSANLQLYTTIQVFGITIIPIKIVWYYHNDND